MNFLGPDHLQKSQPMKSLLKEQEAQRKTQVRGRILILFLLVKNITSLVELPAGLKDWNVDRDKKEEAKAEQ